MPELPEVETTMNGLKRKVLKRAFIDAWSDWEKMIKRPTLSEGGFELFKKELKRKKILKIWRRAKNILFDLSDGYTLLVHQKMTGHLLCGKWSMKHGAWTPIKNGPLSDKINLYIHVLFTLDDGNMIALSDYRKFAKVELWKTKELLNSPEFKNLGPEPLEKSFTFAKFKECFFKKRGRVKQVIMDPSVIAGVGNIYASEALWWAKIHPEKDVSKLSEKELKELYKAIIKVLKKGIEMGGESFADYRNVDGKKGKFDGHRKAYKREKLPCYRCKNPIKRIMRNARSAFFCPRCQTLNSKH